MSSCHQQSKTELLDVKMILKKPRLHPACDSCSQQGHKMATIYAHDYHASDTDSAIQLGKTSRSFS
jgi:hypothetical protein